MSHVLADLSAASPVRTVAEAGTYIASVCFKHGPPERVGLELEWLLTDPREPSRQPDIPTLLTALGPHAPRTLNPDSRALPLPGGGLVTVEPGGQVEISSPPHTSVAALIAAMRADEAQLARLLEPSGFTLSDRANELRRPPHRILLTPRYDAMASRFASIGPAGATMMCASAAAQVCVDLGEPDTAAQRWQVAHLLGPVLLAAFANSPADGVVSQRMAAWWELDSIRTLPPTDLRPSDYVNRALHTPILARQQSGDWLLEPPATITGLLAMGEQLTTADLDLHLSMLFPPVRPQGYLELRYLDAQPTGEWPALLALIAGLFAGPLDRIAEICRPVGERWRPATAIGLADQALATAAGQLAELVPAALDRLELTPSDRATIDNLLTRRLVDRISPALEVTS